MSFLFIIVGKFDNPIFRLDNGKRSESSRHVQEFIIHSSLDVVDELVWKKPEMYLKAIDRIGDNSISSFVTASSKNHLYRTPHVNLTMPDVRFMLLHDFKGEDAIKAFFVEVYELYMKVRASSHVLGFISRRKGPSQPILQAK